MRELDSNPIRIIRVANHKSLQELALICGVNLQTLYLNECGVFPTILPTIRVHISRKFGVSEEQLEEEYKQFVLEKRRLFAENYKDRIDLLPEANLTVSPTALYRQSVDPEFSRMGFAKTLCVEPAGMYRLEVFPLATIPGRIRDAFLQVGMSSSTLEEMEERTNEFYARTRKTR